MTFPRRDDDVAAWLKTRRDEYLRNPGDAWGAIDDLLDEWRLRADVGAKLTDPFPSEGEAS